MARYPDLPTLINVTEPEAKKVDLRDQELEGAPSTNIFTVVTITNIGRPKGGDISYSASSGKFRGYVSTAASTTWKDLN